MPGRKSISSAMCVWLCCLRQKGSDCKLVINTRNELEKQFDDS